MWIGPNPRGHILATGRDARRRKQYRYHPEWRALRDATKFDRMAAFASALPAIRSRLADDLGLRGLPREKVLAAVVSIIDRTLIRVGNEEYARQNGSFGATTLRDEHAHFAHGDLRLSFRGKSGKQQEVAVSDRRVARVVRRSQELPGEQLFEYLDETGAPRAIDSGDVNDYLREVAGEEITVKDFRTWGGSVLCHQLLLDAGAGGDVCRGEEDRRRLGQARGLEAREHARGLPGELHPPGDHRGVPRRRAHGRAGGEHQR